MPHLCQQVLILKTLLCIGRHSPRVDDLPPSNVGKLSLSKLGQLVPTQPRQLLPVKDGQLICQISSTNLPSNLLSNLSSYLLSNLSSYLSSQLTLKGPVMISWPGCHLQFSHSPWTWSPTSIPTLTPTSTSISLQEKYRNCICFYKSHLFRTRLNCRNSLNAALSLLQVMIMKVKQQQSGIL